jgi:hypothetical protein
MAHFDLNHRLTLYGYGGTLDDFDIVLAGEWFSTHVTNFGSVESMLHYPKQAIVFCDSMRNRVNLPNLEDYEILGRLTQLRKQGRLKCWTVALRGGPGAGKICVCRSRTNDLYFAKKSMTVPQVYSCYVPKPKFEHITYTRVSPTVARYMP